MAFRMPEGKNTIDLLVTGDKRVLEIYLEASKLWDDILSGKAKKDDKLLCERIISDSPKFEKLCGKNKLGREVMGVSGMARFCSLKKTLKSDKQHKDAVRMYRCIMNDQCSTELEDAAQRTLAFYRMDHISRQAADESHFLYEAQKRRDHAALAEKSAERP